MNATALRTPVPCLARPPRGTARVRLFCFHHAGGAASAFRDWQGRLGPDVEVLPVQLPGRENRVREPAAASMAELVADLDAQLGPVLDEEPYVLYGHSMGGLVAHELALARRQSGRRLPDRLIAGACPAPDRRPIGGVLSALPDSALVAMTLDGSRASDVLLSRPDWMRWMLALLRDDLRVCDGRYGRDVDRSPLPVPFTVFAGLSDPLVSWGDVEPWARHTRAGCRVIQLPGGHFFPRDSGPAFFARLAAVLDS